MSSFRTGGARNRRRYVIAACVTALTISVVFAAAALAATYDYCSGCTINGHTWRISNSTRDSDLSYVHRLSGPSGTSIATQTTDTGGGQRCINGATITEVTCTPSPGHAVVFGWARNNGDGNYGFNAHLRY